MDLNLGDSIAYTHLKPTRINLENKDYPAEFAIINKEDLKLNFNTTGTQGRTQKQEAINTALAKKSGAYKQESLVDEKDLAEIPLPQDLRWEVSALKSAKTDYSYIIKHKKLKNQDDELKKRIVRESIPIMQSFRTKIEQALNLHPTKDFGTNYAEYYRDGQGAITKIIAEAKDYKARKATGKLTQEELEQGAYKGQVAGAFYRKDLESLSGNGNIDVV